MGDVSTGDSLKLLRSLDPSDSSHQLVALVHELCFDRPKLIETQGMFQTRVPDSSNDTGNQVEHLDIGVGQPCLLNTCPRSCRCCVEANLKFYISEVDPPASIWIPMSDNIHLNIFIGSHQYALQTLELFADKHSEMHAMWKRAHPECSPDEWKHVWVGAVVKFLSLKCKDTLIQCKRLSVPRYTPVIIHGLAAHSGTKDVGFRLFGLHCPEVLLFFSI